MRNKAGNPAELSQGLPVPCFDPLQAHEPVADHITRPITLVRH
jgi:hypothetical protein